MASFSVLHVRLPIRFPVYKIIIKQSIVYMRDEDCKFNCILELCFLFFSPSETVVWQLQLMTTLSTLLMLSRTSAHNISHLHVRFVLVN